jgi:raffinose/stachyose/melibiose transport system permease protein
MKQRNGFAFLISMPAVLIYSTFVIYPLTKAIQYSFTQWDGIGEKKFVGFSNYSQIFHDPSLVGSIKNSLILIIFFSVFPVSIGLVMATFITHLRNAKIRSLTQIVLFLPQIIPLAASGIAWSWMYAQSGLVNQFLNAIGLSTISRPWLADFSTALPAVGLIGAWVLTGFCAVLFASGIGKIDISLYEAIRLDGANWFQEFFQVTVRGLKQEISVLVTISIIAALSSFDIIYVTTLGGPGGSTLVPGISIYRLAFTQSAIGLASAFGIILMLIVLVVVLPAQLLSRRSD